VGRVEVVAGFAVEAGFVGDALPLSTGVADAEPAAETDVAGAELVTVEGVVTEEAGEALLEPTSPAGVCVLLPEVSRMTPR
jgi:hypothetical protein